MFARIRPLALVTLSHLAIDAAHTDQFLRRAVVLSVSRVGQRIVDRLAAHRQTSKQDRDIMVKAYDDSIQTMKKTVYSCLKQTQRTNVNISRLTKTQAPRLHDNYLAEGVQRKDSLFNTNKFRNSTLLSKTGTSAALRPTTAKW